MYKAPKPGQTETTPKYPAPSPRFKLEPKYYRLPITSENLGHLIFILAVVAFLLFN